MTQAKLRVLHLITELVWGGAQDNTFLTVDLLDRSRFEVHLGGAPGVEEARASRVSDKLHVIRLMRRGIAPLQNIGALLEILAIIKKERYHIVHTHSTNAGILGRLAGRLAGVPIVLHTVHGFGFDDRTFPRHIRTALVLLEKWCASLSDRLVMVSELNRFQALRMGIAGADKMVVIHSGVDLAPFSAPCDPARMRRDLGIRTDWPVVGWVGRFCAQNAPEVFVRAALQALKICPATSFVMAGDGPEYHAVQRLAAGVPQVTMLGYRTDIPQLLRMFDVFVSTVRWAGLGRAVTEALIAGRAVVATSVNGVPEIVHDRETGLLVPPDDPAAVADRVLQLLHNPTLGRRMGRAGAELVVPEFGAELMIQRITNLYDDLLISKGLA